MSVRYGWALLAPLWLSIAWGCSERAEKPPPRAAPERVQQSAPAIADEAPVRGFQVPDALARQRAIGSGGAMSPVLDRALYEQTGFVAKRPPESGDWLDAHAEPGQGFDRYVAMRPNRPSAARSTIYIVPIGDLRARGQSAVRNPSMKVLAEYVRVFFDTPVSVLPAVSVADVGAAERGGRGFGDRQLLTTDILTYLSGRLPEDAYALVALTAIDLYPEPGWNFVFGQASLRDRVGVYSLARYQPRDDDDEETSGRAGGDAAARRAVLRRALKVMSHELGHMFGIMHCVYFECVMNGSNSLAETDSQPMHLCPVDLRKVLHATGSQPVARYRRLARFYERHGLAEERAFMKLRLEAIEEAADTESEAGAEPSVAIPSSRP